MIENGVFVDTSFFIALVNSNDADHTRARQLQARLSAERTRKITSEYVLVELGDGLSRLRFRHLAIRLIALIKADATFQIVGASSDWFDHALALYGDRRDKEWGLTDCTSFAIMEQMGISAALTADRHYRQAGYVALLLEQNS